MEAVYTVCRWRLFTLCADGRQLREMFLLFDTQGTGFVCLDQMMTTLTSLFGWRSLTLPAPVAHGVLCRRPTRYEAAKLFESVDLDRDGLISFSEFALMMSQREPLCLAGCWVGCWVWC